MTHKIFLIIVLFSGFLVFGQDQTTESILDLTGQMTSDLIDDFGDPVILEGVVKVNLRQNRFTEIPEALIAVKSIKYIDVNYNPITCEIIDLFKKKRPDVVIASNCFDKVIASGSSNDFIVGEIKGNTTVLDIRKGQVLEEGIDAYYLTGCDMLITTKGNKLSFEGNYKENLESFSYASRWISHQLDGVIKEIDLGHCEMQPATVITTVNGVRYWCQPFQASFGKMNLSKTQCAIMIEKLKVVENVNERTVPVVQDYFNKCECDEKALERVKLCLDKMNRLPRYYRWDTLTQSCEPRKISVAAVENISEEKKSTCLELLKKIKGNQSKKTKLTPEDMLKMEAAGCITITLVE